jgi:hypothetical protein
MPRLRHLKETHPLPWERQPEESDQAWDAFVVYRDTPLDPDPNARTVRSNRETARRVGKTRALMDKWATRHSWKARALAYDNDLDRERRAKLRSQALAAVTQHAQLAGLAVRGIAMPLQALSRPQILTGPDGETLLVDGVPQTRDRQFDLERMATPGLLLLMRQVAALMPTVITIRMDALGNPHEPLPEVPEWGAPEDAPEVTTPDRMRELLDAMGESGLLTHAGMTPQAEQAAVAEALDLVQGNGSANGEV